MASIWIVTRTQDEGRRRADYLVEYRLGGREAPTRYGGSFKTKRLATIASAGSSSRDRRGQDPRPRPGHEETAPTFAQAARTWRAARVDVAASTSDQHRIQIDKLLPIIGDTSDRHARREEFIDVVAQLHGQGVARETIRKTLGAGAMVLDHAGVTAEPGP